MEVFHYHKAVIDSNYKLWHDTNSEFYHDYMHYHNRITGFNDEYFARKCYGYDHGHVVIGSFEVQYEEYEGFESRAELSFPGLPPNQFYCPSSKQMGLLSVFHKGGSGSSLFDVKPLGVDGSSGGFGWSVF